MEQGDARPTMGLKDVLEVLPEDLHSKIVSEIFKMSAPTTTLSLWTQKMRLFTQEAQELDDPTPQVCVCVCVCEIERERERERVCAQRERERERERKREKERESFRGMRERDRVRKGERQRGVGAGNSERHIETEADTHFQSNLVQ